MPLSSFSTIFSSSASAFSKLRSYDFGGVIGHSSLRSAHRPSPHQRLDMHGDGGSERLQVIAAFEHRNNAPSAMAIGRVHQIERDPGEIRLGQIEAAQRIAAMRIEARRDDEHIRLEGIERRKDHG